MFFSVNKPIKIAEKECVPCICYELPKDMEQAIKPLVNKGIVNIHENRVQFCNGRIISKKESEKSLKIKNKLKGF